MASAINIKRIGDWKLLGQILTAGPAALDAAIREAVEQEAEFFVGKIRRYMRSGKFEPLSPNTIATARGRSGGKPLFRSGDLRNSITKVMDGHSAFIGVPRSASGKGGKGMVNIAAVHEYGATVVMRMTPAMRRFLWARLPKQIGPRLANGNFGSKASTGIIVIKIPARPFIAPVFAEFGPGTQERFVKRLSAGLTKRGIPVKPTNGGDPAVSASTPSVSTPSEGSGDSVGGIGKGPADRSAAARKGWATRRRNAASKGK